MNERILIMGLDGLSWRLIRQAINNNVLPNVKHWAENGYFCKLNSTIPPVTYVALPSFMTGVCPPKLSQNVVSSSVNVHNFSLMREKAFWELGNIKSCIVNLRCTYKPRPLNGIMIAGDLYTPSKSATYTYPSSLQQQVADFHKNIHNLHNQESDNKTYQNFLKNDTIHKLKHFNNLIRSESYDLSLFWDGNLDSLQHNLWLDKDLVFDYLKFIDNHLKSIFEISEARNIFLLSDHGFDTAPTYGFNVNSYLRQKGYIKVKGGVVRKLLIRKINSIIYSVIKNSTFLFKQAQKFTESHRRDIPFTKKYPGVDYDLTKVQLSRGWWGIEINSIGMSEEEYQLFRKKIINELREIRHNKKQVVHSVWSAEDLYGVTARGKKLPDIYLLTKPEYKCQWKLDSDIFTELSQGKRSGAHYNSRDGFFLAYGQDVHQPASVAEMWIQDIAPTILWKFGITVPEIVDGRNIEEIFTNAEQFEIIGSRAGREKMRLREAISKFRHTQQF